MKLIRSPKRGSPASFPCIATYSRALVSSVFDLEPHNLAPSQSDAVPRPQPYTVAQRCFVSMRRYGLASLQPLSSMPQFSRKANETIIIVLYMHGEKKMGLYCPCIVLVLTALTP